MNKKAMEMKEIAKWIIGLAILLIVLGSFAFLKAKGVSIGEFIQNIFRYGA